MHHEGIHEESRMLTEDDTCLLTLVKWIQREEPLISGQDNDEAE